jgi:hypothetical protein
MNFVSFLFEMYVLLKPFEMKIWLLGPTFDIYLKFELSWCVGPVYENSWQVESIWLVGPPDKWDKPHNKLDKNKKEMR